MRSQKSRVLILVTVVLTEPMCQSSLAFNIKGQTNSSSAFIQVSIPSSNISGTVTVTTKTIEELERGGTDDFLNILGQSYGDNWQFKKGANLKGGFNVTTYYPCHPLTPCGSDLASKYPLARFLNIPPGGSKGGVGATFSADYERNRQDEPNPSVINDTFWIQRATVNTGGQPITVYGQTKTYFDLIDTPDSRFPFFPGGGLFGRTNPQTGELLSSALDVPCPTPAPTPSPSPCSGGSGGGGCRSTGSLNIATQEQEMPLLQNANFANNDENVDLVGISSELLLNPELSSIDGNNPNTINYENASTDDSDCGRYL